MCYDGWYLIIDMRACDGECVIRMCWYVVVVFIRGL